MRFILLLSFLLLLIALVSFDSKPSKKFFVPPGTVRVNDTLYFDKTEISNAQWREYADWKKREFGDTSTEYKSALLDTLVWREKLTYCEPYVAYYHSHPAYSDYPVVGMSYEQAASYCKWRTDRVKQSVELNTRNEYGKKILPATFNYHLPSKSEWEEAAKTGLSEKSLKQLSKKKWQGVFLYNAVRYDSTYTGTGQVNPEADITAPVNMYFPNQLGIYNLFGNVGEMIAEKGIYKGGGWLDKMNELKAERDYRYEKPQSWLGFRCVCEVHWTEAK